MCAALVSQFRRLALDTNNFLRHLDWRLNRSHGGWTEWLGTDDTPVSAVFLTLAITWALLHGPILFNFESWFTVILAVLILVLQFLLFVKEPFKRDPFLYQGGILVLVAMGICLFGEDKEADLGSYKHLGVPLIVFLVLIVMFLARPLADRLVSTYRKRLGALEAPQQLPAYPQLLTKVDLFVSPPKPGFSGFELFLSFVTTPVRHPIGLLLPTAVVVLSVPQSRMTWSGLTAMAVAWVIVSVASADARLGAITVLGRHLFYSNGKVLLTLGLVALAACRYDEISYVATVINAAPGRTLFGYIAFLYVLLWFYELWTARTLTERLLPLFSNSPSPQCWVGYDLLSPPATKTLPSGRVLQVHGGGRFAVQGHYPTAQGGTGECFETYTIEHLIETLVFKGNPGEDNQMLEQRYSLDRLRRPIAAYLAVFNLVPFLVVLGLILWGHYGVTPKDEQPLGISGQPRIVKNLPPEAEWPTLPTQDARPRFRGLRNALFGAPRGRAILVAASGGGTRAALYTASLLRGLQELGALNDVVLISGASGGSAAAAYYVIHYNELVQAAPAPWNSASGGQPEDAWATYSDTMAYPFIEDVLRGSTELRCLTGRRSGELLAESFTRHLALRRREEVPLLRTLSQSPIGLIFGTTLVGEQRPKKSRGWHKGTCERSGGALLITNVAHRAFDPEVANVGCGCHLECIPVYDPQFDLCYAAALSANFPPVFSNAAITVEQSTDPKRKRYWVTDGGAAENRGIVALLRALKSALADEVASRANRASTTPPPKIIIIVADASALPLAFTQDRGLGSILAGGTQYATQLSQELLNQIANDYRTLAGKGWEEKLKLRHLVIPSKLYSDGGMGTHWMLPSSFSFDVPVEANGVRGKRLISLNQTQMKQLLVRLHARPGDGAITDRELDLEAVWLELTSGQVPDSGGHNHQRVWKDIKDDLR